ncbi:MAG: hypothetical protein K2H36_03950 [Clostridia bacterium]|nr:hypothetical protein [Clostridia bacterium]MDE6758370.1 hypothetical protein [Clostridia bacterium]
MRHKKEKSESIKIANSVLFTAIAILFFAIMFFWSYEYGVKKRNAIEGGVIVEAEIVSVGYQQVTKRRGSWYLEYEYIDDNGVSYWGWGESGFAREDEARSYIGSKIEIYIDGKGNSIAVGHIPGDRGSLIVAIVLTGLAIIFLAVYIKLRIKKKDKKQVNEKTSYKRLSMEEYESIIKNSREILSGAYDINLYIDEIKKDIQTDELTTTSIDEEKNSNSEEE